LLSGANHPTAVISFWDKNDLIWCSSFDGFVKVKMHFFPHSVGACAGLDPADGIKCSRALTNSWTPFFNGVTTFYEIISFTLLRQNARWLATGMNGEESPPKL
jgi:hypothetical protein